MSPSTYYGTLNCMAVCKLHPDARLQCLSRGVRNCRIVSKAGALCDWQMTPNKAWRAAAEKLGVRARKPVETSK